MVNEKDWKTSAAIRVIKQTHQHMKQKWKQQKSNNGRHVEHRGTHNPTTNRNGRKQRATENDEQSILGLFRTETYARERDMQERGNNDDGGKHATYEI